MMVCLFNVSCTNRTPDGYQKNDKVKVKTIIPEKEWISFPVRASGLLSSKTEIKLSFKTGGIIEKIYTDEGQIVKSGQLLAELNLSEIGPVVVQARLVYEKAQRDLYRVENLYNDSVATLEQLQNAKTALEYAGSQLNIASFNSQYSKIFAPSGGKILKKLAEVNEMIAPGYPLFLFSSEESGWILRVALADVNMVNISINDSARITFDAFPETDFNAVVSEIARASDPYTGTYEVELRLIDNHPHFASGLVGKTSIIPSNKNSYISVPINVIHEINGNLGYVYVIRGDSFEKKQIKVLEFSSERIYLTDSFPLNEKIISEGAEYLTSGKKIEVIE